MAERQWSAAELTVARAASSVPRPDEGAWLNAGTCADYWQQVARAVLDALTAAGWCKATGIIRFDHPITPEQAARFRAVMERAQERVEASGQRWAYELHVRLPWWRRLLGPTKGSR